MTGKQILLVTSVTLGLALTQTIQAHHSFSQFNGEVQRVISGEVVRWDFNNPHVWIHLNAAGDDGESKLWSFEGSGLVPLLRRGIDGNTFKPGDQITLMYCPLRDGRPGGAIGWVINQAEEMLSPNDGGCRVTDEAKETWLEWLKQGFTSNIEADASTSNSQ